MARLANASPANDDGVAAVTAPEESPIPSPVSKPDISRCVVLQTILYLFIFVYAQIYIICYTIICFENNYLILITSNVFAHVSDRITPRYGRDYYINDAKHAAGKTPGPADDWLPLSPATPPPNVGKSFVSSPPTSSFTTNRYISSATSFDTACDLNNNDAFMPANNTATATAGYRLARRAYSMRSLRSLINDATTSSSSDCNRSLCDDGDRRRRRRDVIEFGDPRRMTDARATADFEALTLRGNVRRDCLCSRNGTDNFVVNPLFVDD